MMNRRRFLTISAVAATFGLSRWSRQMAEWRGLAMGADVSITLYGTSEGEAAAVLHEARETIARMERLFSLYNPASEISQLNADGQRELPPEFIDLMRIAGHAHAITGGLFDPTVQAVFAARLRGDKPAAGAEQSVGWKQVTIGESQVRFGRSAMAITLNGIAQGFATDRVRDVLAARGFERALVNIGEYRAGPQSAMIGVGGANGGIIAQEDICNAAIASSSVNGFRFADGGSHLINPLGPEPPHWAGVSVIAGDAARADALSTALILAKGQGLAERLVAAGEASEVLLEDYSGAVFHI